jgi:uncharacterized membrane protein
MIEDDEGAGRTPALSRTLALSDGIFAIAITLLAFQIQAPDLTGHQVHHLAGALGDLSRRYYVFILTFFVVGLFWLAHLRLFRYLIRVDESLMRLNLLFLMAVAIMPFPSAVLGRYGGQEAAVVLYAAAMAVAASLLTGLWVLCQRRRLLAPSVSEARVREGVWRSGSTAVIFLISVPVGLAAPGAAPYVWITVFVARWFPWAPGRRPVRAQS